MAEAIDPFSDILNTLWTVVMSHPPLGEMVRPLNALKGKWLAAKTRYPLNPADAARRSGALAKGAELRIVPVSGGGANLTATSSSAVFVQNYQIGIQTALTDPDDAYFPIKWEVMRAFGALANPSTLDRPDLVTSVRFIDLADQPTPLDPGRQVPPGAWAGLVTVSVDFRKSRAELAA